MAFHVFRFFLFFNSGTVEAHSIGLGVGAFLGSARAVAADSRRIASIGSSGKDAEADVAAP